MFSKELEEVIEAALADGVITEKERAVLHKRAAAEGVDPDELDIVIDGRLAKIKKQEDWLRPVPPPQVPQNNKHGVVRKCPNCGAQVGAGSVKCAECGYEFVGIEANSSMAKLLERLQDVDRHSADLKTPEGRQKRRLEVATVISTFPIPTTKEDLLEFILFIQSKTKYTSDQDEGITRAYKEKYEECIDKVKLFFANDPQFKPLLEQYEKNKKKIWANLSSGKRVGCIIVLLWVVMGIIAFISSLFE